MIIRADRKGHENERHQERKTCVHGISLAHSIPHIIFRFTGATGHVSRSQQRQDPIFMITQNDVAACIELENHKVHVRCLCSKAHFHNTICPQLPDAIETPCANVFAKLESGEGLRYTVYRSERI